MLAAVAAHAQGTAPPLPAPLTQLAPRYLEAIAPEAAFGYPINSADPRRWPGLILAGSAALVEREMQELNRKVFADIKSEQLLYDACIGFRDVHGGIAKPLDAWVTQAPQSANALAARSLFRLGLAEHARGEKRIANTPREQLDRMEVLARTAWSDGLAALQRDSAHYCAYAALIEVGRLIGDSVATRQLVRRVLRAYPGSYILRDAHLYTLTPRWGGSYEEMEAFVRSAQVQVGLNGRLANLRGKVLAERAHDLQDADQFSEAIALYSRAVAIAPEPAYLHGRAVTWRRAGDPVRAVHDLHRALTVRPRSSRMLELHARALLGVAQASPIGERNAIVSLGISQLKWLQAVEPINPDVRELLIWAQLYREHCRRRTEHCPPVGR